MSSLREKIIIEFLQFKRTNSLAVTLLALGIYSFFLDVLRYDRKSGIMWQNFPRSPPPPPQEPRNRYALT